MKILIEILAVLLVVVLLEVVREHYTFCVTHYKITSEKLKEAEGTKVLFLSDLHNQRYGRGNIRLLARIRKEAPDMVLIGGDMLVGKEGQDCSVAVEFVTALTAFCPVYYANGNHEQRMKEQPEKYGDVYVKYKKDLSDAGVHFLENESEEVHLKGAELRLTGLEIPANHFTRFKKKELTQEMLELCVGRSSNKKNYYKILLAHNPTYMKEYLKWGADLVLSGHLHGGMVRIPGLGGVVSPGFKLFPKYSGGCYEETGQTVVVSRGLGSHTIPVRLFNPAEVIVLEFHTCETGGNLV